MNFFQQNLDLIGRFFKKKAIFIRRQIFIFFLLKKKKKKNEMAQGTELPKAGYLPLLVKYSNYSKS